MGWVLPASGARLEDFPTEDAIVLNEDRYASEPLLLHLFDRFCDVEQYQRLLFASFLF